MSILYTVIHGDHTIYKGYKVVTKIYYLFGKKIYSTKPVKSKTNHAECQAFFGKK